MNFWDYVALMVAFFTFLGIWPQAARAVRALNRDDLSEWFWNFLGVAINIIITAWLLSTVF